MADHFDALLYGMGDFQFLVQQRGGKIYHMDRLPLHPGPYAVSGYVHRGDERVLLYFFLQYDIGGTGDQREYGGLSGGE